MTWYGPNDVITLSGSGSTLTEYPVNGGTSTSQLLDQYVDSITASSGQELIAGVAKGGMLEAPTLTGAWTPVAVKGVLSHLPRLRRAKNLPGETLCRMAYVTFGNQCPS